MLDTIRKNGVRLALFAAVTTGLTAVINAVTKPTIDHQTALQQKFCWIRWYRRHCITTKSGRMLRCHRQYAGQR